MWARVGGWSRPIAASVPSVWSGPIAASVPSGGAPKRRSVSKSLTLFYTVSLLCLLLILYFFLYLFTNRITTSASQPLLKPSARP